MFQRRTIKWDRNKNHIFRLDAVVPLNFIRFFGHWFVHLNTIHGHVVYENVGAWGDCKSFGNLPFTSASIQRDLSPNHMPVKITLSNEKFITKMWMKCLKHCLSIVFIHNPPTTIIRFDVYQCKTSKWSVLSRGWGNIHFNFMNVCENCRHIGSNWF